MIYHTNLNVPPSMNAEMCVTTDCLVLEFVPYMWRF